MSVDLAKGDLSQRIAYTYNQLHISWLPLSSPLVPTLLTSDRTKHRSYPTPLHHTHSNETHRLHSPRTHRLRRRPAHGTAWSTGNQSNLHSMPIKLRDLHQTFIRPRRLPTMHAKHMCRQGTVPGANDCTSACGANFYVSALSFSRLLASYHRGTPCSTCKDVLEIDGSIMLGLVIRWNRTRRSRFGTWVRRQIGDASEQDIRSFEILDIAMVLSGVRQQVAPQCEFLLARFGLCTDLISKLHV
jgi:hypothetical protein